MKRLLVTVFATAALGIGGVAVGLADSTPVGPLPAGPLGRSTSSTGSWWRSRCRSAATGRVWRVAQPFDSNVLRQVSEADVGSSVVLVFRARSAGRTTIAMALTKGDASAKALESRRFLVRVR